jgi:hypothetical protein
MKQLTQLKLAASAGFIGCLLASSTSADAVLSDFTFAIRSSPGASILYSGFVAPWNGSLLGGSGPQGASAPIWTGPVTTYTGDGTFQLITINTGLLNLTPGNWVIGLDSSDATSSAVWGLDGFFTHVPGSGGGGFNFNNGPVVGVWDDFGDFGDLAFSATLSTGNLDTFPSWDSSTAIGTWGNPQGTQVYGQTFVVGGSVVPEASSSALAMGLGFVGLAFFRRLKR